MTNNFLSSNLSKRVFSLALATCMSFSHLAPIHMAFAANNDNAVIKNVLSNKNDEIELIYNAPLATSRVYDSDGIDSNRYFYNQLDNDEKRFYDAMVEMYEKGYFEDQLDFDILGHVDESDLENPNKLLGYFGAAKDAFQYDNPDVFWVDWDTLSLRIGRKNGKWYAYIGTGKTSRYFLKGFGNAASEVDVEKAREEYEKTLETIVKDINSEAKKSIDNENSYNYNEKRAILAHDYIVDNMDYKFEYEVNNTSKQNARTAYDALIYGEGVCEAYTRGYKAIMDRLGIPCVCVYGTYRTERVNEPHIWNLVELDGKWYGVDTTHDDSKAINDYAKRDFCLVGAAELYSKRIPSGFVSPSTTKEFKYPTIEAQAKKEIAANVKENGFRITLSKTTMEGEEAGNYQVSYNGKNYTENAEDGKYMLAKYFTYDPSKDEWTVSSWSYMDPWVGYGDDELTMEHLQPSEPNEFGESYFNLVLPQVKRLQFAVTSIAPWFYDHPDRSTEDKRNQFNKRLLNEGMLYTQDVSLLEAISPIVDNPWGDYIAPPYPDLALTTPYQGTTLDIGKTYEMHFTFNEDLISNGKPFKVTVENMNISNNASQAAKDSVSNERFDGHRTVTFDFTPSKNFSDNATFYIFNVEGLIGTSSKKAPIPMDYMAAFPCSAYAYTAQGFDWNLYAQPQLMESTTTLGQNMNDWKVNEDGIEKNMNNVVTMDEYNVDLSHRLTLVTTETTPAENQKMIDKLNESGDIKGKLYKTNTYNIKLTVCKMQVVKTGQGVRVSLGFPKGTNYEDFAKDGNLKFVVYHYIVDPKTGKLTDEVEEIPVEVTPYGLILTIDSFSPFTVAAVETTQSEKAEIQREYANKQIIAVGTGDHGSIETVTKNNGYEGKITSAEVDKIDKEKTYIAKADDGYVISSISFADESGEIIDRYDYVDAGLEEMNIVLNNKATKAYSSTSELEYDLDERDFVAMKVEYADKTVISSEEKEDPSINFDNFFKFEIKDSKSNSDTINVKLGEERTITAKVNLTSIDHVEGRTFKYVWKREGLELTREVKISDDDVHDGDNLLTVNDLTVKNDESGTNKYKLCIYIYQDDGRIGVVYSPAITYIVENPSENDDNPSSGGSSSSSSSSGSSHHYKDYSDDKEIKALEIENFMEENDELEDLAISLRSEPYRNTNRSNKNIYEAGEDIVYYIDFKNPGKRITDDVVIKLNLPLSAKVEEASGGKVASKQITWTYEGLRKNDAGTLKVILSYNSVSDNSQKVSPSVSIAVKNKVLDSTGVVNLIVKDLDKELNSKHEAYMQGDIEGTFRPNATITRAEAAIVLSRVLDLNTKKSFNLNFSDLNDTYEEARKAILSCADAGIITGYPDGTYRPNQSMKIGEFMAILARQLENDFGTPLETKDVNKLISMYSEDHWADVYATLLARLNMTPLTNGKASLELDSDVTRAEVAQLVNYYLLRAPSTKTSDSGFTDVSNSTDLAGDILQAAGK